MSAESQIPTTFEVPQTYEQINPIPTKLPASSMMNDVIVTNESKTSTVLPYRFANTSTRVNAVFSSLILWAKNNALLINDKPKPIGRT